MIDEAGFIEGMWRYTKEGCDVTGWFIGRIEFRMVKKPEFAQHEIGRLTVKMLMAVTPCTECIHIVTMR